MKTLHSTFKIVCISLLIVVGSSSIVMDTCTNAQSQSSLTTDLESALSSPEWRIRHRAAIEFPGVITDTAEGVKLLIKALASDVENPISNDRLSRSYASNSEMLRRQYIFAIVRAGLPMISMVQSYMDSTTSATKDWLIVALGFLHDGLAHEPLRQMLETQDGNDKKALATRALSEYGDIGDTLLFMSLLNDPYKVTITKDHDVPGGDFREDVYPVREEAAGALRAHRFMVTKDDDGRFRIEGRK